MGWRPSIAVSCRVSPRQGLDLALLWLWYRPMATALIQPVSWKPLYAMGAALKRQKKKKELGVQYHRIYYSFIDICYATAKYYVLQQSWWTQKSTKQRKPLPL